MVEFLQMRILLKQMHFQCPDVNIWDLTVRTSQNGHGDMKFSMGVIFDVDQGFGLLTGTAVLTSTEVWTFSYASMFRPTL